MIKAVAAVLVGAVALLHVYVLVTEMFLWAFARKPTSEDMSVALDHIAKHEKNKKIAYENILWALINTKEFVFNE